MVHDRRGRALRLRQPSFGHGSSDEAGEEIPRPASASIPPPESNAVIRPAAPPPGQHDRLIARFERLGETKTRS